MSLGAAIILLSIVVLTGYAGQLSLAQYSIAGFGAYVAGRLVAVFDIPFLLGMLAGVGAAIPLGIVFGLPAVRTRGINLAIVTLGLGSTIELMVFRNREYTGGVQGTQVGNPDLFGYDIGSINHPERYGIFVLAMALLTVCIVANVRRGRSGRRLIAVRTNERAAAALGIDVMVAKLFAFSLASAIAALGGILLAFRLSSISYQSFSSLTSITFVGMAIVGGVGYLLGAVVGSTMATAGFTQEVLESTWGGVGRWTQLISGISILLIVLYNKDGVASEWANMYKLLKRAKKWGRPYMIRLDEVADTDTTHHAKVPPQRLAAEGLTVRYGAVTAVDDVSFELVPGRVTGLIGPNGAGKTSLIDAFERVHTRRRAGGAGRRRRLEALSQQARASRRRSVVPVARAVRGFDGVREHQRRCRSAGLRVVSRATSCGRSTPSSLRRSSAPSASSSSTRISTATCTTCRTASAGCSRSRAPLRCTRACSCSTSRRPASSSRESAELGHVVRRLADEWGMAILVVEHDMNFVMEVCDDVLVLDFGRRIAAGSPAHIRHDPAVIAAYLGEAEPDDVDHLVETPAAIMRRRVMKAALLDTRLLQSGLSGPCGRRQDQPARPNAAKWSASSGRTVPARPPPCSRSPVS